MKQHFAVICNNHIHRLSVIKMYMEKFPTGVMNKTHNSIEVGNLVFNFVTRDRDPNELGSWQFLGVIFPPGYEHPNLFELIAIGRARWT